MRWANQRNDENRSGSRPLLEALERYRRANGHYPDALCDLHLGKVQFAEHTQLYYTASPNKDRFWFAYTFAEPHFAFPSDDVMQSTSATREWAWMDLNDTGAKWDRAFASGCKPYLLKSSQTRNHRRLPWLRRLCLS